MDHELDEMVLLRNAWRIAKLDRDKYELQNAELLGRTQQAHTAARPGTQHCHAA
jgi:hypothetical protein